MAVKESVPVSPSAPERTERTLGWPTASAVVTASMVGVGVFSTLSFQVHSLNSPFAILMLWLVGAVVALLGALSYAELGAALPRSGGEYHLLSRIFHPALGFTAGWVSLVAGFAAPIAAAAMAFAAYLGKVWPAADAQRGWVAAGLVCAISAIHAWRIGAGARFQVAATVVKILLMLALSQAALFAPAVPGVSFAPLAGDTNLILSSAFAVSLVYVSYAYSGWNAAVYIAGETKQPQKTLPLALAFSTLTVAVLYLLVNYAFLRVVPISEMLSVNPFAEGDGGMVNKELAVGFLAGSHIFGAEGAKFVGLLISACLISTVSAMVLTGPRVLATMAQDYPALTALAPKPGRPPIAALLVQLGVILILLASAKFEAVVKYTGLTLSLFASLTVIGQIKLRISEPELVRPFRCPGYPFTPLVFLGVNAWMIYYLAAQDVKVLIASVSTIVIGLCFYAIFPKTHPTQS
jgi:basic amino acid/polyamine antiporter, APA family